MEHLEEILYFTAQKEGCLLAVGIKGDSLSLPSALAQTHIM